MKSLVLILILGLVLPRAVGDAYNPNYPASGIVSPKLDSFFDPNLDYSRFPGRVTDRDKEGKIVKIKSETRNVKFLKIGDQVEFSIKRKKLQSCIGYVRDVEDNYLVLYVQDISACWEATEYLRRGTQLNLSSKALFQRIVEGSNYRMVLLKQKEDFMGQLNDINHFLWSFDQQKVRLAAKYDQQIVDLQKRRQKALDGLILKRKESLLLQKELIHKLDQLEANLNHYRVEREEWFTDRWHLDRAGDVPTQPRPQKVYPPTKSRHRWANPQVR